MNISCLLRLRKSRLKGSKIFFRSTYRPSEMLKMVESASLAKSRDLSKGLCVGLAQRALPGA